MAAMVIVLGYFHIPVDGAMPDAVWVLAALFGGLGAAMLLRERLRPRALSWALAPWRHLWNQEPSFMTAFLDSPDPICIATMDRGHFVAVNRAFERVLGYTQQETCGRLAKSFSLWDPPESRIVLAKAVKKLGHVPFYQAGLRSRDGTVFDGLVSANATRFQGEDCMILTIHDITPLLSAQRTLLENEQRLRLITANVGDVIERLTPDGKILFASEAARAVLGYDPKDMVGHNIIEFIHPDDDVDSLEFLDQVRASREASHVVRLIKRDGQIAWIESRGRAVVDEEGAVTEIITMSHDVTDRRRGEERERARHKVHESLARGRDLPSILNLVADYARSVCPDKACAILLMDQMGQKLVRGSASDIPGFSDLIGLGFGVSNPHSPVALAAKSKERVTVADLRTVTEQWPLFCRALGQHGFVSVWAEPIFDSRGKLIGGLALLGGKVGLPDDRDQSLLAETSCLAALAIEQKRIEEELLMTATVYGNINEGIMVADANHKIISVNPAFSALTGYAPEEIIGQIHEFLVCDTDALASLAAMEEHVRNEGTWRGELWTRKKDGSQFLDRVTVTPMADPDGQSTRYISIHLDITEQKNAEERIWKQANFDALTNLPNRRLFRDRLSQEISRLSRLKDSLALLFIDLDKFKEINDTLGHEWGDHLLVEAAKRISNCVRQADTVARLGGDEFTVILPGLSESRRTDQVAQAIVDALRRPFMLNGQTLHISGSVGVTLFPADAEEIDELIRNADQAMYVAKGLGRNQFSYFTATMQTAARERHSFNRELRSAIDGEQFEVYFQPIIQMSTGRITKAEALVRWNHPELGVVGPDRFIPIAEENGLIIEIGDWVFREAARVAKEVNFSRSPDERIVISVNMSPRQFYAKANHQEWLHYLDDIGLDPAVMGIEITESLLLEDHPDVAHQLNCFREAGIRISLDDFGKGYSSLSYLKKFPIDYLKIDREFIRDLVEDLNDRAISEAIIVMAHRLGIKVVAEGIENIGQHGTLRETDCDEGQGFLFSKPVPLGEFVRLLFSDNGYSHAARPVTEPRAISVPRPGSAML